MKTKAAVLSAFFICILSVLGQGQNSFNDFTYYIKYVPTGQVNNNHDTVYTVKCRLDAGQIANLSKVEVKVWSNLDNTWVINNKISLSPAATLPQGLAVSNANGVYEITLGTFAAAFCDYEIRLEDAGGSLSDPGTVQFGY